MGIVHIRTLFVLLFFCCSVVQAGLSGSTDPETDSVGGGGIPSSAIPSLTPDYGPSVNQDGSTPGSVCYSGGVMTCVMDDKTPSPDPSKFGDGNSGSDNKSSGKDKGDGSETADTATPEAPPGLTPEQIAKCEQDYSKYQQGCNTSFEGANYSCDANNSSEMNNASAAALALGQQTSESILAACSNMGSVSQAASGALAAYRLQCNNSMNTCTNQCSSFVSYVKANPSCFTGSGDSSSITGMSSASAIAAAENSTARCGSFSSKINEANQAIQNYAGTTVKASQCKEETMGGQSTTASFCDQNPSYPGCVSSVVAVNCLDETQAKTNKVCICAANPRDPVCLSEKNNSAQIGIAGGTIDSSSRLNTSENHKVDDIPNLPSIAHGPRPTGGDGEAVDGRQGSASPVGDADSGDGTSPRVAATGALGDDEDAAFSGGFRSGSGSRGASSSSSSATGKIPAVTKGKAVDPSELIPDLRKFLPGGLHDPRGRGLAGTSGPDGITGPDSDIWQKISNRYQATVPTLLP